MSDKRTRENQSVAGARLGRQNARPTIGVLVSSITHKNDYSMWQGVVDAARKRDVNVICYVGSWLHSPYGFQAQANVIYDLVNAEKLDGLVIMAGAISQFVRLEEKRAFIERYYPLPIVTLDGEVPGTPNIYVDSFQNMRKAVLHLIQAHNYRRIAFIRGPENMRVANERYRAYVETLAEHGIPLDPALVTPPLNWFDGRQGLSWLLDHHADFEAVIGANDDLAMGAIEELRARGIRVPEKVAVVGYDDAAQSRWITPPLTTIPIETYKWGQQALEMVLTLMEGQPVPEQVVIPTELVVRQSCGCIDPAVVQATLEPTVTLPEGSNGQMSLEAVVPDRLEDILGEIRQTVGEQVWNTEPGQIVQLWDAFMAELNNTSSGVFLRTLDQVLRQTIATSGEIEGWEQVVSVLRRQALPCLRDSEESFRAENLWQQGRVLIAKTAQRLQGYRQVQSEQRMSVLREIGAELIATFDTQGLMDVLARQLPRLDIPSAYLALYEDPKQPNGPAKLLLAYNEQGRMEIQAEGQVFLSPQLAPEGSLPQERPYSLIAEPLYFHEDQLGFALFEMGPQDGSVYEALRSEISSALQGALLVQQMERRALQLQTAAEVSRAASSILNLDELLPQVVELIRDRFNLYYVGLFLVQDPRQGVDETGRSQIPDRGYAVLRAGTGEAGRKMLEASHKLEIGGSSMIGWCTAQGQARIALDVGKEAVRFSNPLLPLTRSETAFPLISRGQVIGAVTIQSAQPAAFTQEDVTVLQTMADQLANAIENARLFTERTRAEEALAREQYLMQALMDNAPDYIYFKDRESRFIRLSKAHAQSFGLSDPAQAVGKTDFDFFTEEHARPAYEDEQRIIQTGQPMMDMEEKETRPDRPDAWVSTTKMPLRDQDGNIIGTFGLSRDVSDRKRAELDLKRRALQLQTAAQVSRATSSILNLDELLPQAVELIRDRFNLYYVGLFLVDETGQWVLLRAGTGEAGQKMLKAGHKLESRGTSMIGWCMANSQARIALDVGEEMVRFSNPLLPLTRSEAALPIISRGRVIGAMTIQSDQPAAFTQEDITVLQAMADQLANAIENARLFEQTQSALAAVEATHRRYLGEQWKTYLAGAVERPIGYVVNPTGLAPASDVWTPEMEQALSIGAPVTLSTPPEGNEAPARSALAVPIQLHGLPIGVLDFYDEGVERAWSKDERALVEALADQIALALENARLFEQTQQRARREQLIAEIAAKMRAAPDVGSILRTTVHEIRRALGVSHGVIRLGAEATRLKPGAPAGNGQTGEGDGRNER